MGDARTHSDEILIQATPEQVWEALTTSAYTTRYFPGHAVDGDWRRGSYYAHKRADGTVAFDGTVIEAAPPRRLVQSVNFQAFPEFRGHEALTLRWDIEPLGDACRVTIIHHGPASVARLFDRLTSHCAWTLSGLKTLLETGQPLVVGQPVAAER